MNSSIHNIQKLKKPIRTRKSLLVRCLRGVFYFSLLFFYSYCQAYKYEVQGIAKTSIYTVSQIYVVTTTFQVSVDDCRWLIVTKPSNSTLEYFVKGFDGTNLFTVRSFRTNSQTQTISQKDRRPLNVADGYICDLPAPFFDESYASFFWLAYASQCYFASAVNTDIIPPYLVCPYPQAIEKGYRVRSNWLLDPQIPHLPREVVYWNDGHAVRWNDDLHVIDIMEREPPFNTGYTNAILTTENVTNVDGLSIPLSFTFVEYAPLDKATSKYQLRILESTTAWVTNFSKTLSRTDFAPKFQGETLITDFRFIQDAKSIDRIPYLLTDEWLAKSEVQKTPAYVSALHQSELIKKRTFEHRSEGGKQRSVILGIMVFFSLIFGASMFCLHRKRFPQKN